jgi:predicted nucleotide-binding protein
VINSDDLTFPLFKVGHFVGKLGTGRVCVLHMSDVEFPRTVPGVLVKPIVVKLEEASLSLMHELKNAGYQISL